MSLNQAAPAIIEADPSEVHALLDAGEAVLVDVREPEEFEEERIPGALLRPLSQFDLICVEPPPSKLLVLHCLAGSRSARAARSLQSSGIGPIVNMRGGILAWKAAGLPTAS